jgi:branched-chain amino acid transport system permease protein
MRWQDLYGHQIVSFNPWAACVAALVLTGLVALAIGASVIRLKGHYLAMATLGFGLIVYRVTLGTPILGRADGVSNVPPFPLFGSLEVNGRAPFRAASGRPRSCLPW